MIKELFVIVRIRWMENSEMVRFVCGILLVIRVKKMVKDNKIVIVKEICFLDVIGIVKMRRLIIVRNKIGVKMLISKNVGFFLILM